MEEEEEEEEEVLLCCMCCSAAHSRSKPGSRALNQALSGRTGGDSDAAGRADQWISYPPSDAGAEVDGVEATHDQGA
jgi:hypothetical protein